MNRRSLLKSIVLSPLAGSFLWMPSRATAIEPGTAIAVARFAINASTLFKGSSVDKISEYQLQQIAIISEKIGVVVKILENISAKMDAIQKDLANVPSKTVLLTSQTETLAACSRYADLFQNYKKEGPRKFKRHQTYQEQLTSIRSSLEQGRAELLTQNAYITVPTVLSALHAEVNLMHMAGVDLSDFTSTFVRYRSFFNEMLIMENGLNDSLRAAREKRNQLLREALKPKVIAAKTVDRDYWGSSSSIYGGYNFVPKRAKVEPPEVLELRSQGLILADEFYVTLERQWGIEEGDSRPVRLNGLAFCTGAFAEAKCVGHHENLDEANLRMENNENSLRAAINLNMDRIAALSSLQAAAHKGLFFAAAYQGGHSV
ncbi:MAG: hypothetical protein HKN50_02620 [Gammaproteobacteria bacterium]|nr:hypothetical protein [Gammaproteobacteria bacterium]